MENPRERSLLSSALVENVWNVARDEYDVDEKTLKAHCPKRFGGEEKTRKCWGGAFRALEQQAWKTENTRNAFGDRSGLSES